MMQDPTAIEEATLREKLAAIRAVVSYRPELAVGILALTTLLGALEGIGVGFILPLLTVVENGPTDEASGAVGVFVDVYAALGLPFTVEYIVLGVTAVMAVRYSIGVGVSWLSAILGTGYRRELRVTGYDLILEARTAYFDRYGSEELLNAILTQTGYASRVISKVVRGLNTALISLAYALVALYIAPWLTLLTGAILVCILVGSKYLFESGFDLGERLARANELVQVSLQAGIQGIREVKLFSMRGELREKFGRAVDEQTRTSVKRQRDQTALANLNQFAATVTVFALIYLGLTTAALSLPSLGVFLFAMYRLAPRLSSLNGLIYDLNNDLPHLIRTQAFLARLAESGEDWGNESVPAPVERVSFNDVGFGYPTGDEAVLHGIDFTAARGEFVAFVGASGAGKSTVAGLLAGLYRADAGEIRADGTPIERFSADGWRSRVAVVEQSPHIFNETLRYNLTLGRRDATQADIEAACAAAQVDEFLDALPDGYETVLGDDGVRLSGGQRQRVAIARALLKNADVLVLDEATSELDTRLERRVHDAIEGLEREYATVAIAHRLSTVRNADCIHVMADGRIVESGCHRELLERGGAYASLYNERGRSEAKREFPDLVDIDADD